MSVRRAVNAACILVFISSKIKAFKNPMLLHSSYSVACRHSRNRNLDTRRNKVCCILARTFLQAARNSNDKTFYFLHIFSKLNSIQSSIRAEFYVLLLITVEILLWTVAKLFLLNLSPI